MLIRWSNAAVNDLEKIGEYLNEHNPSVSKTTLLKLYSAPESLKQFPIAAELAGNLIHVR